MMAKHWQEWSPWSVDALQCVPPTPGKSECSFLICFNCCGGGGNGGDDAGGGGDG